MHNIIRFSVSFIKGKQRPRMTRTGHMYTPRDTASAELAVAHAYKLASKAALGKVYKATCDEVVTVQIDTFKAMPKSLKMRYQSDVFKPDIDNVIKLVLDGLNNVAYLDDKQVVSVVATKHGRTPRESDSMDITVKFSEKKEMK